MHHGSSAGLRAARPAHRLVHKPLTAASRLPPLAARGGRSVQAQPQGPQPDPPLPLPPNRLYASKLTTLAAKKDLKRAFGLESVRIQLGLWLLVSAGYLFFGGSATRPLLEIGVAPDIVDKLTTQVSNGTPVALATAGVTLVLNGVQALYSNLYAIETAEAAVSYWEAVAAADAQRQQAEQAQQAQQQLPAAIGIGLLIATGALLLYLMSAAR
ncbi:hypothetical protein D9Q98_004952 [Chlorella vulgaris]|uniref:Uncharacterized protein n=1 Tax=Chlorella vulgaris TaxID=3077 RepID=A0A9D4TN87_CHLVU|nr:hypothetical protein D9Q98_004952 [Chlorella vulgaris]